MVAAIWKIIDSSVESGPPVILEAPEGTSLTELLAEVGRRAGRPRNLAADGFTDPSLTERTGLPLVEPFGDELLEMRGWAYGSHWIGCGRVVTSRRERTVVVIAKREDPAVSVTGKREDPAVTGFPEGASWAEKLRILTDWDPVPQPAVNWPAVEADLATSLPSDYKEIVDLFGPGGFDEYVDLLVPGALGMDLVGWAKSDGDATDLWEPYASYPAPRGSCGGVRQSKNSTSSGRPGRPIRMTGRSSWACSVTGSDSTAVWVSSSSACSQTCSTGSPQAACTFTSFRVTISDPLRGNSATALLAPR